MYIADLHIHSRYSRATSKDCTPEHLDLWARRKGIQLVGTGDFTHPAWREELEEKLEPAGEGLYRLKESYKIKDDSVAGAQEPRFVITGEISSIYKKRDKVRKVHSLILLPGLSEAEEISRKLEAIGNIHSDGRPILGLDCHDLLEILLELCPDSIYVPAHIWTPHFSMFGAFSGFDSVEECFEDLSGHIHAVETGLSSDPPMNWRVSALDRYQLISNSDAHSPAKLGREANLLNSELSYPGLKKAVETGEGLYGTIEFFPEEGKYHYDGHRKCHLCLTPLETDEYQGICPVCQKKLTIGVAHRVQQLSDRPEGYIREEGKPFESLVPLPEVIGAALGHSSASKAVQREYEKLLKELGPEFSILREIPVEEIRRSGGRLIAEGIRRLREGKVERIPGYDGEYGTIRLFTKDEMENPDGQMNLFQMAGIQMPEEGEKEEAGKTETEEKPRKGEKTRGKGRRRETGRASERVGEGIRLNQKQEQAAAASARVTAVTAGPGTGKTQTLIAHLLYLLKEREIEPGQITAVTFTNRAAAEVKARLQKVLGKRKADKVQVGTFHHVALRFLKAHGIEGTLIGELEARDRAAEVVKAFGLEWKPGEFLDELSAYKTKLGEPGKDGGNRQPESEKERAEEDAFAEYQRGLQEEGLLDFDDILLKALETAKTPEADRTVFSCLLIDEFQDISPLQYRLVQAWNRDGKELFVIGDKDQSIYGFRGADGSCFERLSEDCRKACGEIFQVTLEENYRSTPQILLPACRMISANPGGTRTLAAIREDGVPVRMVRAGSRKEEGIFIAKEINRLTGGMGMLEAQEAFTGRPRKVRGFGDIAVLYRTHRQALLLETCLRTEGIPYVVTGREDYLLERSVAGTEEFFRSLTEPENSTLQERAMKHLLHLFPGELTEEIYRSMAQQYQPLLEKETPEEILKRWIADLGLEKRKEMEKLLHASMFYERMDEFLEALETGVESDIRRCGGREYQADAVTLMTLHGAKGLEFPAVIVAGAEEGMIPYESSRYPVDLEEERRLLYVGMTRAKEELILTCCQEETPFLKDLDEKQMTREKTAGRKREENGRQMSLFEFLS